MYDMVTLADKIEETKITAVETYDMMAQYLVDCSTMKKEVKEEYDVGIDLANQTHKHLTGKKKAKIDLIVSLESAIKEKRLVYKQAQDKIKEEEQLVLDEAEAERVKEEQARLLEEAEKAETPEEREALEEKADEVVEKVVTAPTVVNDKQKVASGGSTTWIKDIEVVITDAKQVCKSVASGAIPITVVEIKPTKLKAWAKLTLVPEGKYKGFNIINKDRERVRS